MPPLGMEEKSGIRMYPNLSEGSLSFATGDYGSLFVQIYRMDGLLVCEGIARDTAPINIENLAGGSLWCRRILDVLFFEGTCLLNICYI